MSSPVIVPPTVPDEPKPLTPEQVQKIRERLAPYMQQCPICKKEGTLQVLPGLVFFRFFQKPGMSFGVGPAVVLSCSNCGNIQFHNVHLIGLAKELEIPPPSEPILNV